MKVTKLEHATLVLEQNGETLILDPGFYTRPMDGYKNVVGIAITHNHDDHVHEDQIDRILKDNPDALILGTQEVVARLAPRKATAVHHGDFYEVGPFTAEFFGSGFSRESQITAFLSLSHSPSFFAMRSASHS